MTKNSKPITKKFEVLKKMSDTVLISELLERGYKWCYVYGHGTDEPAGSGDFVIADVEKVNVLIAPQDQFNDPIKYEDYF